MADISVSAEQNIDLSVKINADTKLQQELEETRARAEQLDFELRNATNTVKRLSEELNHLKTDRGILELEEHLDQFSETARRSLDEFNAFIKSVQLQDYADYGDGWSQFQDWIHDISTGAKTASEAIAEVKSEYSNLIMAGSGNSSGTMDSQMLRTFTSTLKSISNSIDEVREKLSEFQENGIRAIANEQGSDNTVSALEQVKNTIKEMADDANGAYEPLTRLINVMSDYANIDNTKLFTVSQAIAGLGEIGKGSYSVKSVENTINLLTRLQTLTKGGSINFNVSGLEAFSNLSIRKASLNNLATFLPTIASVDVGNLERLSHVDLSNFNNLDIKKTSMNNLVQMIEALNNTHMDTSWSSNLVQSVNEISKSVSKISESMGQGNTVGLNIDKSSFQGLEDVLNDINHVIQNSDISKLSGEMSEAGDVAQRVAIYLGRYRDALNDAENTKVYNSLTDLGIAAKDADVISQHLSDMHIKVKAITPEWETITKIIDDEIIKEQKLKQITVQGTTALGDAVNHVIKFNAKTGDISKEITRATVKGKEFTQTMKELADGTKETNIETTVAELEEIDGLIKSIEKTNSTLNSSRNKVTDLLGGLSTTGQNREELDAINKKFDELMVATERLKTMRMTANQDDIDGLRKIQEELDGLIRKSQERIKAESKSDDKPKTTKVIDFTIDEKKVKASLDTIHRRLEDLKDPSKEVSDSVKELDDAFDKFNQATTNDDKKQHLEDINKLISIANKRLSEQETIQNRKNQADRKAETSEKQSAIQREQALKRALTLLKQIEQAEVNWTAAKNGKSKGEYSNLSTYASDLRKYISQLESGKITTEEFNTQINRLGISFQGTGSVIRASGEAVKSFGERVKTLGEKFSTWFSVSRVIMSAYSNLKKMVSASIELDNAMSQLQIVTKESDQTMGSFGTTAAESAKRIGSSITDFVSSATTFARLGYSLNESSQLAEFTAMLQNVGDIDVSQAQDAITSIVKAFDVDVDQIESVMDKLVTTGNGFPISVSQIAEGMTNASSALSAAGNNFDQSVALLTAANTAVQNASKASTGLRTIAARIRKTKTELDDLGEVMTEADYDKLVQQLTDFNVSLTDINGEYRSTYDIMQDIAAKWSDMSSMEQAALAEALSGNRQQQIFYSIITNFQEASGAMDAMASSAGALQKAYDTRMQSTQAHINQFNASFQELSSTLINSNMLKFAIDTGTALVSLANGLQKIHLLLPSIVGVIVTFKGLRLAQTMMESAAKVKTLTATIVTEKMVTDSLAQSVSLLTLKEKEMLTTNINNAVASGALTQEEGSQILATLGLAAADGTLTVANKTLAGSFKTLMASIPVWGWIALGISTVIEIVTVLSSVVSSTGQSVEDRLNSVNEALKQAQSEVQQLANEYSDLKKQSEDVIPRFVELAKGVNEFGDNVSLTDEEYKEFLELNNKIAEMFPELNLGMDSTGNAMLSLSYSADTLSDSLYGLVEAQRQAVYAAQAEKMPDILSGISSIEEEYKKQIEKAKEVKTEWKKVYEDIKNQTLGTNVGRYSTLNQGEQAAREMIKKASELGVHGEVLVDDQSDINEGYVFTIKWDYESVDLNDAQRLMEEKVAEQERLIDDYEKRISAKWKELNPAINGWLQTDYIFNDLDSSMQDIAKAMVSGLDFKSLGLKTKEEITEYITENILDPLFLASDDTKEAFKKIVDWKDQLKNGEITAEEFTNNVRECFDSLKKSIPADQVDGFTEKFVTGFNAMGFAGNDFDSVVQSIIQSWSKLPDSNDQKTKTLTDLSDVATKLKSSYDLIATAEKEMNDEGGISASTIKALADATDNYMDYLYEENGVLKLNTKAWKEYIDIDILNTIKNLKTETETLSKKYGENSVEVKNNQKLLELYNTIYSQIGNSIDETVKKLEKVQSSIKTVSGSISTLIGLSKEIEEEGVLSLSSVDKILSDNSLAKLRPYINDVKSMMPIINSLINDQKQAYEDLYNEQMRLADPDAYLEAVKKKEEADENAFNDAIKRVQDEVDYFSDFYGVDITNWGNLSETKKAMLQNTNAELVSKQSKLINDFGQLYNDDITNFSDAVKAKAEIQKHFEESQVFSKINSLIVNDPKSMVSIDRNTGKALRFASPEVQKQINSILSTYGLTYADYANYRDYGKFTESGNDALEKYIKEFASVVKPYNISTSDWEKMTAGSSGSSKSSSKEKTWFEKQYNYHKHLVSMEQETENNYFNWLDGAYKQAYSQGIIDLDAYYKYEEEVYNGRKKLVGDNISWFEKQYKAHQHYLKMETEDQSDYLRWLDSAYKQAYKEGLITLDEYRKYQEEVYEGIKQLKNNAESAIKELINIRINMLKEDVNKEKEAIKKKLDYLKDFYQKQKDMLQDKYDEEKYLEEQAEKRKSVSDIQAEMNQLKFDNSAWAQKRRIELQKDLTEAQKNLKDFEKDHALNDAKDRLDKLYEQQEKTLNDQSDALDKKINNPQELYQQALNDIRNGSQSLYQQMIEWNNVYGDGIRDTIKKAWEEAYKAEKQYFNYTGRHYNGVNLSNATLYVKGRTGYASGTSHSTAGLHKVDEQGIETIFQSSDGQRYRMFSSGEKVLNAGASDFLYKFANRGTEILGKLFGNSSNNVFDKVHPVIAGNEFNQGDIIINGNADRATVSEIRRAQRESLEQMLKQFNRLK